MIEKTAITAELYRLLAAADPEGGPGYLVECLKLEHRDASRWSIWVTAQFAVTCRDGAADLLQMQEKVLEIFAPGYLLVGDRALHITASGGRKEGESAGVEVTLEYLDDRPERREDLPNMAEVHTTFAETKGGA